MDFARTTARLARALACSAAFIASTSNAAALPSFNADPSSITVSGISSGAMMAVQAHVAYSGTFRGAAIFAGAAYYCAQGSLALAIGRCQEAVLASEIPVADLVAATRDWSARGLIDDAANLASSKVFLFSGTLDQVVRQPGMDAARDYYLNFVSPGNVVYNNQVAAGHGWISPLGQVPCPLEKDPHVNNCAIDPEQTFLEMFYGPLQPRQVGQLSGVLSPVDQNEFLDDHNAATHSMDNNAWVYVPAACAEGQMCKVHVAYHGCNMSYSYLGDQFMRQANLNEWADTNRIIVLYPQAIAIVGKNGLGCWDWWGYDTADYAKKSAPQLLATKRMVDRITSGYAPVGAPGDLFAAAVTQKSVRLTWNATPNAAGYRIYRGTEAVGTVQGSTISFIDGNLSPDTEYAYAVRAVAPNGNAGPPSATLRVRTR